MARQQDEAEAMPGFEPAWPIRSLVRPPMPHHLEYPVYVVLKLQHCARLVRGQAGIRAITARWLHGNLVRADGALPQVTELHGVTSHFIRERLRNLNHGTVLQEIGPGLRNALNYAWNERANQGTLQSYAQLENLLPGRTGMALDVSRLLTAFGLASFSKAEFLDLFLRLRARLLERQWNVLTAHTSASEMRAFLLTRLHEMAEARLVTLNGDQVRLTSRAELVAQWFDLVVDSVDYPLTSATSHSMVARATPAR